MMKKYYIPILLFVFLSLLATTISYAKKTVIVYTSHDQIYSEPVLKSFEEKTGISVKAVYDVEATKTTGIVNRLIAEKNYPRCDVFWNNEHSRTIVLKRKGLLAPFRSASAKDIPSRFKDPGGFWTDFAARARVIICNAELVKTDNLPDSIFDFTEKNWKGNFTIANPLFGTTGTHAAALFSLLGDEKAKKYFSDLKANSVIISEGNSVVKDQVANGEIRAGLTDTDDVNMAVLAGKPVKMIYPDQDGIGTLLIPNTVCLIKNGPNPENGRKLVDYLLSPEVESRLAFSKSVQVPVRKNVKQPETIRSFDSIRSMDVGYEKIADKMEEAALYLQKVFLR
ncbi:MAG: extracellular solute-binding protein [Desulfobacteraceae bacterium]|nr:extracellular solute-binding protein [Desulfobacteraceae bacterium]